MDIDEVCSSNALQSFSSRSNNMQMTDGARQLGYEHLHLLLMFVIMPFHIPSVSMVNSCYNSI